jgi:hypothetical protein
MGKALGPPDRHVTLRPITLQAAIFRRKVIEVTPLGGLDPRFPVQNRTGHLQPVASNVD